MFASVIRRVGKVLLETLRRFSANDGNLLAASMAYYAAFSFFPLMLVLLSGLGFALELSSNARDAEHQLLALVSKNVAPAVSELLANVLSGVRTNAALSGPLGILTLLIGAIAMFTQLDQAFDRLWRIEDPDAGVYAAIRRALGQRLKAFLILLGLGVLIIVAFLLSLTVAAMQAFTHEWQGAGFFQNLLETLAAVAFHALIFAILYKTLPKAKVHVEHAVIGGLTVAIIWELGRRLMSLILVSKNYSPYGVVGSFIALMVWVYYASSLLFLGAQLVQVLGTPKGDAPSSGPSTARQAV